MNTVKNKPDRNILFSLLAGIHLSAMPLYANMPLAVILLVGILSLWQFIIIRHRANNPAKPVQLLIILTTFLIIFYSYGRILGMHPGISLITLMTILKLFETRTMRDGYIIVYSSLFIVASNFFQTQSIWITFYIFIVVIFLYSILIALSDRLHSLSLTQQLKLASRYTFLSVPVMLVLFLLFPRIPGPLWGLPDDAFTGKTGLSEEMSPGSINQLISSSEIAFRVKFNSTTPPNNQLYWRGAVLPLYDGKTWRRYDAPESALPNIKYQEPGKQIYDYVVTLQPTNLNWLLALEQPVQHEQQFSFNREAMIITSKKVSNVISYSVSSQTSAINQSMFKQEAYKNRLLPVNLNPRTHALANEILRSSGYDAKNYINNILTYFRTGNFSYTLNPALLGNNAMDDFLFVSRRGFCEHYASAFVYLMRAAGIPSRVVIGYQGGKMNPLDDYMIVRQSDAHAWTEVWLVDRWVRIDPTAAVSPNRIEQGVLNSGLEENRLPLLLLSSNRMIKNLSYLYDSFQNSWNQWIIGFNQKKQKDLLKWLGYDQANTSSLVLLLVISTAVVGVFIAWLLFRPAAMSSDRTQHYYNLFCEKLKNHGIERRLNEGPVDFENRIHHELTLSSITINDIKFIFNAYRKLHYGNNSNKALAQRFIKKIKQFKIRKANNRVSDR